MLMSLSFSAWIPRILPLVCAMVVVPALSCHAQPAPQWINPSGGNFNVGGNWSTGMVPGPLATPTFTLAGPYEVILPPLAPVTNANVNAHAGMVAFLGAAMSQWTMGANFKIASSPMFPGAIATVTMENGSYAATNLVIAELSGCTGALNVRGGAIVNLTNLSVGSRLPGSPGTAGDGSLQLGAIGSSGPTVTVSGTMRVGSDPDSAGSVSLVNTATLNASPLLGPAGAKASIALASSNLVGEVTLLGGAASLQLNNGSTVTSVHAGSRCPASLGDMLIGASTVHLNDPASSIGEIFIHRQGRLVEPMGSVINDLTNTGEVLLPPGPAALWVGGNFANQAMDCNTIGVMQLLGGRLELRVSNAGPSASRLEVGQTATLGGTLDVGVAGGEGSLDLGPGQAFTIVQAAAFDPLAARFDVVSLPLPGPDRVFELVEPEFDAAMTGPLFPRPEPGPGVTMQLVVHDQTTLLGFGINSVVVGLAGTPTDMVIGDFNLDGNDDLAITVSTGPATAGSIVVLLNDGMGGTFSMTVYPAGNDPSGITAGQFDPNGTLDLAATMRGDSSVWVLANNGAGAFVPLGAPIGVPANPVAIGSANFDASQVGLGPSDDDDLVVASEGATPGGDGEATVLLSDGAGGFLVLAPELISEGPISVDPADVDNDRDVDVAIACVGEEVLDVLLNDGTGNLSPPATYPVNGSVQQVKGADLDGDDLVDLVTANSSTGSVSVFVNDGAGTFGDEANFAVGADARSLEPVDLDGDGDLDLAVLVDGVSGTEVAILRNNTDGPGAAIVFAADEPAPVDEGAKKVDSGEMDDVPGRDLVTLNEGTMLTDGEAFGPLPISVSLRFAQVSPAILGACCLPGDCRVTSEASCALLAGVWHGKATDCTDADLDSVADICERQACPADIAPIGAPNGVVNVDDLLAVINAWGACADPNNCPADIAPEGGNDVVNVDDLLAVINGWGDCG